MMKRVVFLPFYNNTFSSERTSYKQIKDLTFLASLLCVKVSPDKRKGLVSVYQSDDQLMHLTWKDRGTGTLEDDLIIFPDDCEFLAVPACTTGRVFVLKFKTSNKRMFFWMQEPKADKDEEFCKKVNESLNQLPGLSSFGRFNINTSNLGLIKGTVQLILFRIIISMF